MGRPSAERRRRALMVAALMATTALVSVGAEAQQTGLAVASGQASITSSKSGDTVIRHTTKRALLNWQSFSIASATSVQFVQPNAGAIALNRFPGPAASLIDGQL